MLLFIHVNKAQKVKINSWAKPAKYKNLILVQWLIDRLGSHKVLALQWISIILQLHLPQNVILVIRSQNILDFDMYFVLSIVGSPYY